MPDAAKAQSIREPLQRHDLLLIDPAAWDAVIRSSAFAAHPLLAGWSARGWPVIVRRRQPGDAANLTPVGVPFPPDMNKQRISLQVPPTAILSRYRPPPLADTVGAAPDAWRDTLGDLCELGAQHAVNPSPFGSLLWQALTGLRYLSSASDLDLLWPLNDHRSIPALLAGIAAIESTAPMRIDGELALLDGGAVSWRELAQALRHDGSPEVLVKTREGAMIRSTSALRIASPT